MPVTLKTGALKYRNSDGTYGEFNAVAAATTDAQIASIRAAGASEISAIENKGNTVVDSIPDDYTTLSSDVQDLKSSIGQIGVEVPTYAYEQEVLFNLQDLSSLERGSYVNDVWTPSESGTTYATGYVDIEQYGILYIYIEKNKPQLYTYDENKNFLAKRYIGSEYVNGNGGAKYFCIGGSAEYFGEYKIYAGKQIVEERSKALSTDVITEKSSVATYAYEGKAVYSSFNVIGGESYTITKLSSNNHQVNIREYTAANPEVKYSEAGYGNYAWSATYTAPKGVTRIEIGFPYVGGSGTITGKFVESTYENPKLKLVSNNFTQDTFDAIAEGLGISVGKDVDEVYYNCTKYGVLPANEDNTAAFNELIATVNANGGGIIWIPNGTYNFIKDSSTSAMSGNAQNNVYLKSNVSILGESLDSTILKLSGSTQTGCSLFGYWSQDNSNAALVGCTFSNFTVDMSDLSMSTYSHKGKAFYVSGIKDCVFRDLRLLSTPSTSLGIDMLDNVVIDSVYVYQGGRQWTSGGNGGAGIGIGTGKWSNENYIIRNCVCDSCGHFGIFLEDQGLFASTKILNYSKGQIIANNVVRNGRNYGIGLRGGRYVQITGNNIYSNTSGGIYLDYGADQSMVCNNLISNTVNAINFGNESTAFPCTKVAVINNVFAGCTNGVVQTLTPTDCVIENNITM